jgi:hypothetical protein
VQIIWKLKKEFINDIMRNVCRLNSLHTVFLIVIRNNDKRKKEKLDDILKMLGNSKKK